MTAQRSAVEELICYHGTTADRAKAILEDGFYADRVAFFAPPQSIKLALHHANNKVELARYAGVQLEHALIEALLPDLEIDELRSARMVGVPPEKVGEIVIVNAIEGEAFHSLYRSMGLTY